MADTDTNVSKDTGNDTGINGEGERRGAAMTAERSYGFGLLTGFLMALPVAYAAYVLTRLVVNGA